MYRFMYILGHRQFRFRVGGRPCSSFQDLYSTTLTGTFKLQNYGCGGGLVEDLTSCPWAALCLGALDVSLGMMMLDGSKRRLSPENFSLLRVSS